ncbi:DUF2213 domain-containing protein [Aliarcobacter lanthieri]|uniref:DUF2213 domain-containing protein n=1 Tax=Aliarcobacter lanthieri TaxID=1355374 RepID=UPI003AAD27DB
MSKREYDQNGYLIIKDNPITKTGVFEYLGSEIGLSPDNPLYNSIVKVYRSEDELIKALDTFNIKPIINEHTWLGKNGMPVEKKGVIGATGETSYFEYPYIKNTISFYSQDIQDEIDNGKKDLSAGYSCKYVTALTGEFLPKNGIFNGEQYQYEQVNISCNHIALVDIGRSGPDVSVLDTKEKINTKDKSMTLEELLKLIAELSPEDKTALFEALKPTTDEKAEKETKDNNTTEETKDADVSANEVAEVVELVEKAEELIADDNVAEAETVLSEAVEKAENIEAKAMDSLNKRIKVLKAAVKKDKEVKSFDSSKFLKEISERDKLAKGLTPLIGVFDHSAMTLNDVAMYGAKKLDVVCTQDTAVAVVKAVLSVKQKEVKTQDASTTINKTSTSDVKSKLWGVK